MLLVDIQVPVIDQVYDFRLNDEIKIATLLDEIVEMITQKEQLIFNGSAEELMLCWPDRNLVLPRNQTLVQCGVVTGSHLLLV